MSKKPQRPAVPPFPSRSRFPEAFDRSSRIPDAESEIRKVIESSVRGVLDFQRMVKTLNVASHSFVPLDDATPFTRGIGDIQPNTIASDEIYLANVSFPENATITGFDAHMRRGEAADKAVCALYRISDSGATTLIGAATHGTTGWNTESVTGLTEDTSGRRYALHLRLRDDAGTGTAARLGWAKITYQVAAFERSI